MSNQIIKPVNLSLRYSDNLAILSNFKVSTKSVAIHINPLNSLHAQEKTQLISSYQMKIHGHLEHFCIDQLDNIYIYRHRNLAEFVTHIWDKLRLFHSL